MMNDDMSSFKDVTKEYDRSTNTVKDDTSNYTYMIKDHRDSFDTEKNSVSNKQKSVEIEVDNVLCLSNNSDDSKGTSESAVDLSKPSTAADKEKESDIKPEKETPTIKQESSEEIETREDETDSDDTIIDEPVKKKKKLKKKKDKSDQIFKCKECNKVYSNPNSFKKHQNYHAGLFKCKICNKAWNSNYALTQHEKVHTGDKEGNLCGICGKTFSDTSSLNKHHKSVHEKITFFSCDKCDLKFYARKTYDEHMRVHTGERPFKCKICPKTYKRVSDLNHHIRGHTGETKHVCELCGKGVRRLSELKIHMNAHRQKGEVLSSVSAKKANIVCNFCGRTFLRQDDLDQHTKEHHEEMMQTGLDRGEHDSALIAAAIDSEMHDDGNDEMLEAIPVDRTAAGKETISERDYYYEQMRKLYQHASIRPQRTDSLKYNSQMPISDASFHAYFPIPSEEKSRMKNEQMSNQVSSEKQVDNWLNRHFSAEPEKSKLSGSDLPVGNRSELTEMKWDDVQQTSISTPSDVTQVNNLAEPGSKQAKVTKSNDNASTKTDLNVQGNKVTESMAITKREKTTYEKNENTIKTISGEKQKSIAIVVDKLAERKAKDFTKSETLDHLEIKIEVSDGDETDDYEFETITVEENKDTKPLKKKKSGKGTTKEKGKKDTLKIKVKPKSGVQRQRKRTPKRLQKSSLKADKLSENDEDNPGNNSVKSEKESDIDELKEAVNSAMKDGLYLCTECHKTFQSRAAFRNHKQMHEGLYTCSHCNKSLSSSWSLQQHMQTHSSVEERAKFPCDVCGKSFCDKSSVNKHVRSVHMNYKPFKCSQCDLTFSERKTMREHMRVHTGERPFLCAYCPKTFKRVAELNHHIRGHTGETKHTCDTCGRGFRRQSELQRHMTLHTSEKPHRCPVCGKDFRTFSCMREHTLRHYGNTGKHVCPRCGKHFFKRLKLERHMRSYKYCTTKCRYCLIVIENQAEREKHEATHEHDGTLKYVCTVCGKHFRAKGQLNKHVRIHTGERSYVCEQCGAAFVQSNHLKQHVRKHTGERPYHCLICGKSFAQSGTLYSHMKTHISDAPQGMTKQLPVLKEMGVYHSGYDSGDSVDNEIKVLGAIQDAVAMIGTSVAW